MNCLLVDILTQPSRLRQLSLGEWDLAIRQARHAGLLSRLAVLVDQNDLQDSIPEQVQYHLTSAEIIAQSHRRDLMWELHILKKALAVVNEKLILLKGSAYVLKELPAGRGRVFNDIDILVPKSKLQQIERVLMTSGWVYTKLSEYDQRYYKQWMHELPPLRHAKRNTTLDVHHTIIPETAKLSLDISQLFAQIQNDGPDEEVYTLSPIDMVLHSATHLFCDGELEHGLRDLVDLDALFVDFSGADSDFWKQLCPRAQELGLSLPLYYAIRYTSAILETDIPDEVMSYARKHGPRFPKMMDLLFSRALMPDHSSCQDGFTGFARWALYVRSHYLRMPLRLLVPHLLRKAWKRRLDSEKDTAH